MIKNIMIVSICLFLTMACKDDSSDIITGNVELNFENSINGTPLVLNTSTYINGSDESYQVSELKYIISNIVLITADDEEVRYPVAESYFLINQENASSLTIPLQNIKANEYKAIRFGFGIDQQNYPLNGMANFVPQAEETGMLWNWAAGYKFIKFEGTFTSQTMQEETPFLIHVGSHGNTLDNYKEITLALPSLMTVDANVTPSIPIRANVAEIFDSGNTHSLSSKSDIQVDPVNAPRIAANIATMFSIQ